MIPQKGVGIRQPI